MSRRSRRADRLFREYRQEVWKGIWRDLNNPDPKRKPYEGFMKVLSQKEPK